MKLHIDKTTYEPIYLQLANQLIEAIENNAYAYKERLPTEDYLISLLDISKGTVKSTYTYMENLGYVKKIRGSGVYVDKIPSEKNSAQAIIDNFFTNFDGQDDVSATQGYLVFKNKLTEVFLASTKLHAGIVDSSREILHSISKQLLSFTDVTTTPYLTTELFTGGRTINPFCKLLITSKQHYDTILRYTAPLHIRTVEVIWGETKQTITSLCQIPPENTIGIIYMSDDFLSAVIDSLHTLQIHNKIVPIKDNEAPKSADRYSGYSFILSEAYYELYSAKSLEFIEKMRKRGSALIPFICEIDKGSMQNLTDKIAEISSISRRHGV